MDLSGSWRAHLADEDLRRAFQDDDFDDRGWEPVCVPGHWRDAPAFAGANGPLLYRREFARSAPAGDRRAWLRFEGVFAQADAWLDGTYLGDTDGYFFAHEFEVTDLLATRGEHALAVEVACPAVGDGKAKRTLTGAFQSGDHLAGDTHPGGIWRPVRIVETGPVAIRHGRVLCREATDEQAVLAMRLVLDTVVSRPVTIRTRVAGTDHELSQPLAAGENRVEWTVAVPGGARWWPHTLGGQPLHDVVVEVHLDSGETSDRRVWRTGFRTVELRNWVCRVNGERLFLKGANLSPATVDMAGASPSELGECLRVARAAGLDFVRVHTHVARPELYDAADDLGVLVWQDLPLHGRFARSVRGQAQRQAREAVDLLGHHPSVAIWCGHDEPYREQGGRAASIRPGVLRQQVPTWNRTILDRSLKRSLDKNDGTRPVVAHSGVLPHFPQLDGTDAHLWFGWYGGDVDHLDAFAAAIPRHVRFVSAFGAQAAPLDAPFVDAVNWPDVDWDRLVAHHGLEAEVMRRIVPPERYPTFAAWAEATQAHQAHVVKHTIETLRRLKYRPTGGFAVYRLRDVTPQIGFGLIDATGTPKAAWHAFVAACRPVIVVADAPPPFLAPGEDLELGVHVVSDERVDRPDAVISAVLRSPVGERRWRWQGDVPADECTRVGTIEWTVPTTPGCVSLELCLEAGGAGEVRATNRYESRVP